MLFVIAAGAAVVYGRIQAGDDARSAAQADARFAARLAAREIGDGIKLPSAGTCTRAQALDKPFTEAAPLERVRALLATRASP